MQKGDSVILTGRDGVDSSKGQFYYVDETTGDEGEKIVVIGGMSEGLLFVDADCVRPVEMTDQEKMLSVLVDLAGSVKYLTEKIDLLIPKCPDCGDDMCCGPNPGAEEFDDDGCDDPCCGCHENEGGNEEGDGGLN
jgi:hypothetical protein